MAMIDIEHVTKTYRVHPGTRVLLGKGGLGTLLSRHYTPETSVALDEVSMSVDLNECLGIAGASGCGKTTLLKLIAGVTTPTSGKLTVLGRVAALLDTDDGFEPRLSGRANVVLHSRLLGLSRKEAEVILDAVRDFAGLGEAIDQPVASYSAGRRIRLAFAIAAHTSPDIIVMDTGLVRGDVSFEETCIAALTKLRAQGKTIVLALDPAAGDFRELCDRIVTLVNGRIAPAEPTPAAEDVSVLEPELEESELEVSDTEPERGAPIEAVEIDGGAPEADPDSEELKLDRDGD